MKKSTKKPTPRLSPLTASARTELERAAVMAKCLANPKRLGIVEALKEGERTVGDLARHLGIASQVVSVELRIMKDAGAVSAQRRHPEVYYRLSDNRLATATALLRRCAEARLRAGAVTPRGLARNSSKALRPVVSQ